jgi:hypothetical protein
MKYKFKVGDKVKVVHSGLGAYIFDIAKIVEITSCGHYLGKPGYIVHPAIGNCVSGEFGGYIGEGSFELFEEPKYRFKTMEEFQRDDLWNFHYGTPSNWNSQQEMNEFIGKEIEPKYNEFIEKSTTYFTYKILWSISKNDVVKIEKSKINNQSKPIKNEVQGQNLENRRREINGSARMANRRQQVAIGGRPQGHKTSVNVRTSGVRRAKIKGNARFSSNS